MTLSSRQLPAQSSAAHHNAPALAFEPDSVEGSLQEMDGAVVGVDDELAIGPIGVLVSADQKLQGEMFEHEIVGGFKFVIGKWGRAGTSGTA